MTLNSLLFARDLQAVAQSGGSYRDRDEGCAFTLGIRFNQELGLLEVLSFWGEGVGAVTYLAAILSNNFFLAVTGLLFVVVAVAALVGHLGRAGRSWRVVANLGTAWVSRGSLIIAGLVGSGSVWSYLSYFGMQGRYQSAALLVSFAFAVMLIFYAGWLLGSIKVVKLWNGFLFPVTFASHSVASGLMIFACLNWALSGNSEFDLHVSQMALASLAICFALSLMHLRFAPNSLAVTASLQRLVDGDLKVIFLGVAGVLGIALPFFLIAAWSWWRDIIAYEFTVTIAVVAVVSRLVGDLAYRYAVVRAGAYEPVLYKSLG